MKTLLARMIVLSLPVLVLIAVPSVRADETADMRAIIDKAIRASGGEARVAKLRAVTWKTKVTAPTGGLPIYSDESSAQDLDQYRAEITAGEGGRVTNAILLINRKKGWFHTRGKTIDAPADFLAPRREILYFLRLPEMLLPLKAGESKLSPLGEVRIGERLAVGVLVERKGYTDLSVFFDKKTGLLVKTEARLKLPDEREVIVVFLVSDYKDFDGLKHFTQFTLEVDGAKLFDAELSDIRALGELDDSVFAKP